MIFDLDNTMYDWYSAFLPAFYEMVEIATEVLNCDREELLDELRQVHIRHHDVEHPFSLIETEIVQGLIKTKGADYLWDLLDPAFHAFNRRRKATLKLFPGTLETLNALSNRGIRLVAYTDSNYYAAWGRIERLGLVDLFDRVYCREASNSILPHRNFVASIPPPPGKVMQIPSHDAKPNPRVLADIVTTQEVSMSEVAYVGDSLAKDILMAKRAHCYAIWAKYGAHTDKVMYDSLIRISHWTVEDIQRERNYAKEAASIEPDLICEHSIETVLEEITGPSRFPTAPCP